MASKRTAHGTIKAAVRRKTATYGDSFPIFDAHSAHSALSLIGHAPASEQPKIRAKAAKFLHAHHSKMAAHYKKMGSDKK